MTAYRVIIEGQLDKTWEHWFNGMSIVMDVHGNTQIEGQLSDQSALHGILKKIRDLGLTILKIEKVDSSSVDG